MGTRAKPSQLRIPAAVQQWRAEQARRTARAGTGPGRTTRYGWLADKHAIITETLAAARGESAAGGAPDLGPPVPAGKAAALDGH
jgi:hypothetical protein